MNSRVAAVALVLLIVLPVLYVVSIGPVFWLCGNGYLPDWVMTIYSPIWKIRIVQKIVDWELGLLPMDDALD